MECPSSSSSVIHVDAIPHFFNNKSRNTTTAEPHVIRVPFEHQFGNLRSERVLLCVRSVSDGYTHVSLHLLSIVLEISKRAFSCPSPLLSHRNLNVCLKSITPHSTSDVQAYRTRSPRHQSSESTSVLEYGLAGIAS